MQRSYTFCLCLLDFGQHLESLHVCANISDSGIVTFHVEEPKEWSSFGPSCSSFPYSDETNVLPSPLPSELKVTFHYYHVVLKAVGCQHHQEVVQVCPTEPVAQLMSQHYLQPPSGKPWEAVIFDTEGSDVTNSVDPIYLCTDALQQFYVCFAYKDKSHPSIIVRNGNFGKWSVRVDLADATLVDLQQMVEMRCESGNKPWTWYIHRGGRDTTLVKGSSGMTLKELGVDEGTVLTFTPSSVNIFVQTMMDDNKVRIISGTDLDRVSVLKFKELIQLDLGVPLDQQVRICKPVACRSVTHLTGGFLFAVS